MVGFHYSDVRHRRHYHRRMIRYMAKLTMLIILTLILVVFGCAFLSANNNTDIQPSPSPVIVDSINW